jgi:calcineurin-like phosphoesterase family protein
MSRWITSDLHFFHRNIFSFCKATRPWSSVEEMNEALIEEWNSKVKKDHIIYHLGDFSFGKEAPTRALLEQLNGEKVFIIGNHDKKLEKLYGEYGNVFDYYETSHNKVKVCMSHYPMHEWNQMHRGGIMLHGHMHGTLPPHPGRRLDVGYDSLGNIRKLEDVVDFLLTKEIYIPEGGHGYGGERVQYVQQIPSS